MVRQEQEQPWWERPAKLPGEPKYEREREHLRAELARAWRAREDVRDGRHGMTQRRSAPPTAA